jgi:histidinol-phosphate aminotransferase
MMKRLERDNVLRIKPYQPGKPIEVLQRELALKGEICKLASNENPMGPSPRALEAIKKTMGEGNLYPDNSCYHLKMKLAEHLEVSPEKLGIGNGTTELILLIGMAFLNSDETLVMSESSFIMPKLVSQVMDSKLIEVPLKDYRHDLDEIRGTITEDTKIIYLDNPMNPIGTMVTQKELSEFIKEIPEDILLVLDEAYYEYVDQEKRPNSLKFIKEDRNVIVLRTFSKLYGLAGLRVGYCVAKREIIQVIKTVSPPFTVNRLGQVGAAEALEDKEHIKKTLEMNETGRKFLCENFKKMSFFYIPSETNFVTIDVKTDANKVFEELQKKGVIVRPLAMYGKPTFLRVTVGTPEENKKFVEAFEEILIKS